MFDLWGSLFGQSQPGTYEAEEDPLNPGTYNLHLVKEDTPKKEDPSKQYKSRKELFKDLGVHTAKELVVNKEKLQKFVGLTPQISESLLKEIIAATPALVSALSKIVSSMADLGKSVEETKRCRWQVLIALAKAGKLKGDQLLEALRLLSEREKEESKSFDNKFYVVVAAVTACILTVVTKTLGSKNGPKT